jgi:peptidoglycan/LPS O-acetylase OafA/YrhL
MSAAAQLPRPSFSASFLAPYRRITSSGQFIPEVDGLRFLAIFSVFIYHLAGDVLRHTPQSIQPRQSNWFLSTTQILNLGVPMFFIISGFILGAPFAAPFLQGKRPVSLKRYFLRRLTRLEPPYVLSMLLFFALKVAAGKGTFSELFPNLAASLLYLHGAIFGGASVINIVAWSLEIEVQFYILAPLIALVFAIRSVLTRRLLLVALILLATGVSGLDSSNHAIHGSLLGYGQYFLAGFLLADFYLSGGDRRQRNSLWDVISLVGWPSLLALQVLGGNLVGFATPWILSLLYVAAYHGVAMNRFVTNLWIATCGGMCYTIYLLHNYTIASLGMLTERFGIGYPFAARLLLQFLLMTPVLLAVSGLYFRLIERPCMDPSWLQHCLATFARLKSRWLPVPVVTGSAEAGEGRKD